MRQVRATRRGFTLVELLVVIAIIAILVALSGAAYFYWIGSQQRRNTENTMRAVNKVFQAHWNYVIEEAKKETPSIAVQIMAGNDSLRTDASGNNLKLANNDPGMRRARVVWIKIRLMEAFPLAYAEVNGNGSATSPDPINTFLNNFIPPNPRKYLGTYQKALNNKTGATNAGTESAACLLMALTVSRAGTTLTADQLGKGIDDTDVDGIKELVDGWDTPLSFYRFAWNTSAQPPDIQGLNPAASGSRSASFADPLDPDGLLASWPPAASPPLAVQSNPSRSLAFGLPAPWNPATYRNNANQSVPLLMFKALFHETVYPNKGATYVIPVLVSSGADRQLGMTAPVQCRATGLTMTGTQWNDNLLNFNLKGY